MPIPDPDFPRGVYVNYPVQVAEGKTYNAIGIVKKAVKGRPYLRADFESFGGVQSVKKEYLYIVHPDTHPELFI